MKIIKKFFNDCILFKKDIHLDKRGTFTESFNENVFKKITKVNFKCKQINYIISKKNSLRGLHLQKNKHAQEKILRVIEGNILDVVVDLRKKSKYFGKHKLIKLSSAENHQIYIPSGFAHGYLTLSKIAKVEYLCSDFYNKTSEISIKWNDKNLAIKWPIKKKYYISKKDSNAISFNDFSLNL